MNSLQIHRLPVFTNEVFSFQLPNFEKWEQQIKQIVLVEDNKKIHNYSSEPEEQCNVMAKRTAWNSHNRYPVLDLLCNEIKTFLNSFIQNENYDIPELQVEECWINWYGKNNYAQPHSHGSRLSVVFFVDVENTDAKFFFHADNHFVLVKKNETENNFSNIKHVNVKNGTVIFFDGSIRHSVSQNNTNSQRITVAINFIPVYTEKRNEY